MDESTLARVEAQRLELEANITKLKKSLRHWQALEIDYQGLSEEFVARPENLSKEQSLKIARDYGADIVDEKELRELLNYDKGLPREPEQIIELLSKRIDYVNRNVDTIKKQLGDAQKKLNVLLLAEQSEFRKDAGLPLTEITEELDEDGNVVSSKLQRSDEASPQLADVLKKAGVRDIEEIGGKVVVKEPKEDPVRAAPVPVSPRMSTEMSREVNELPVVTASRHTTINEVASRPATASTPEESPEEAALRAEMLQYHEGLGEVGAIVAELDLEEGDISYGEDDDDISIDSDYDEDEDLADDSEDESGMSRSSLQSEAYLRKMKLLQKKHGVTGMSNLGPKPDLPNNVESQINRPSPAEAARKAALARAETAAKSEERATIVQENPVKPKAKKKVAFANTLDIASEEQPATAKPRDTPNAPITLTARPFKQIIVERPAKEDVENTIDPPPNQKVSRFKAARSSTPQTPLFAPGSLDTANTTTTATTAEDKHSGPIGKIYEPNIMEHEHPRPSENAKSPGSDDFGINAAMHQREIASEYHQLRNRMIQRQGGFVGEGEQNNWGDATAPLDTEGEDGKVRKVSRFMAARMK
jgi:unconventional prefoldin RPB5 interactor 1